MLMHAEPKTQYRMRFLWMICLVAAMGGLLFGYDWVVIGGAKPFYEPYFGISDSPFLQGLAKPANDLSRGCSTEDVFNTAVVTAIQCLTSSST